MTERGLHAGAGAYLAQYLRQAGLTRVQERRVIAGTGNESARQQRLMVADGLAAFTNMKPIITKIGLLSEATYTATLEQARIELPKVGITMPITCAFSIRL